MAPVTLARFFHKTPWFVSPIRVPCALCAKNWQSKDCKNRDSYGYTCMQKADALPIFQTHNEPSSIQLFYDLFFVANLSACTTNHEIRDSRSLEAYVGFFTLLWFTWFGTIIFDVRFAIDSLFTRLSKACSFAVMTAFAMSSVYFGTSTEQHFGHDAQMVSLILMASRFFLVVQYGVIMAAIFYRCGHVPALKPLALTMCTSLVAALVFLGLSFSKSVEDHSYGKIGWYIASVAEAAVLLIISCVEPFKDSMGFKDTNIVERMGALSLIIMGEGIIGMTESVSFMFKTSSEISSSTIGLVIAVVLVIYVVWMLYFDHTDKVDDAGARVNTEKPWCQLWAFLHFPLHVAILLTLEGSAKLVLWWNANEAFNYLSYNFGVYYPTVDNGTQLVRLIQNQLGYIIDRYPFLNDSIQTADFQSSLTQLGKLGAFNGTSGNDSNAFGIMSLMQDNFFKAICEQLSIEYNQPPPVNSSTPSGSQALDLADLKVSAIFQVFYEWLVVFLVAAGCVLLLLALARYVGHQNMPIAESADGIERHLKVAGKRPFAWVALTLQCCIGVGLALVSLLAKWRGSDAFLNFITSAWIIPTVLLAFFLVIIIDNFLYYWSSDILHPPVNDLELKHCPDCPRNREKRANEFGVGSKSPLLKPSVSPDVRQLDRFSPGTDYSRASEMSLLRPSRPPRQRDSDALSGRIEYSRLTNNPEEEYGA